MGKKLAILAYHQVLSSEDPLRPDDPTRESFERQMRLLARFFNVVPLSEAADKIASETLPPRAVCITFDDGYADNYVNAWPVIQKLGLPATIFVATRYLDGGRMWNDTVIETVRRIKGDSVDLTTLGLGVHPIASSAQKRQAVRHILETLKYCLADEREQRVTALADYAETPLPDNLMLSSAQVAELADSGIEIGAHTVSHPILASVDDARAREEIEDSKAALERIIGREVTSFAYPNGRPNIDYDSTHVSIVKAAGFKRAVSTHAAGATRLTDLFEMPRFSPWPESSLKFGLRVWQWIY